MEEQEKKQASKPVSAVKESYEEGSAHAQPSKKSASSGKGSSHEELEKTKEELEKAKKEAAANLDGWQRERAEFVNYKKRIEREQTQLHQTVTGSVIKKYLVILDDLDLALKNRPESPEITAWVDGIELVIRKFHNVVDSEGIERINENKVPFDPNLHEAISNEDNPEFASGEIIEVVRQGYKLGDRILRPAMVRVAR